MKTVKELQSNWILATEINKIVEKGQVFLNRHRKAAHDERIAPQLDTRDRSLPTTFTTRDEPSSRHIAGRCAYFAGPRQIHRVWMLFSGPSAVPMFAAPDAHRISDFQTTTLPDQAQVAPEGYARLA